MVDVVFWGLLGSSAVMIFFSLVIFLRLCEGVVDEKKMPLNEKTAPFVTIAIPAWNEEDSLRDTVVSAMMLDYPREKYEIIIVNDGSSDGTSRIAKLLLREFKGRNIVLLEQENGGKAVALNNALRRARGKFFACLDADSFAEKSSLRREVEFFLGSDSRVAAVVPIMLVEKPRRVVEWFQQFEYAMSSFLQNILGSLDSLFVTPGPLSLYRAKVLKSLGGFSSDTLTEDQEIGYRLQHAQYRIRQCSQAFVWTKVPRTWHQLYHQRRRWQYGGLQCLKKYHSLAGNVRYGDFGMFQIPMTITFYLLSLVGFGLFAYVNGRAVRDWWRLLEASGFDVWTFLRTASWDVNLLSVNVFALLLLLVGLSLSFVTLLLGHDHARIRFSFRAALLFLPFAFSYYIFRAFVLLSLVPKVFQRERWW